MAVPRPLEVYRPPWLEREARVLAQLNHPDITIRKVFFICASFPFGYEIRYLVFFALLSHALGGFPTKRERMALPP
jgi:hypothetical protein